MVSGTLQIQASSFKTNTWLMFFQGFDSTHILGSWLNQAIRSELGPSLLWRHEPGRRLRVFWMEWSSREKHRKPNLPCGSTMFWLAVWHGDSRSKHPDIHQMKLDISPDILNQVWAIMGHHALSLGHSTLNVMRCPCLFSYWWQFQIQPTLIFLEKRNKTAKLKISWNSKRLRPLAMCTMPCWTKQGETGPNARLSGQFCRSALWTHFQQQNGNRTTKKWEATIGNVRNKSGLSAVVGSNVQRSTSQNDLGTTSQEMMGK